MFHDKTMLGAGFPASPAPVDALQAFADFDAVARCDGFSAFLAPKGVWFDEGFDLRDPEGDGLTQLVLGAIAAVETRTRQRRGPDAANHRILVRKLLANGLRCFYYRNPSLVACQRRHDSYKDKPHQWLSGKGMASATDLLAKTGLIELSVGKSGTASTYRVTQDLLFMALDAGVTERSLTHRLPPERLVRLYWANSEDRLLLDYEPTAETCQWTGALDDYNAFIAQQEIGLNLSDSEAARLTARMNEWQAKGLPRLIRPELIHTDLYRQFNNSSFEQGGRLYGGWWINCPKDLRPRITINGKPTTELDYSGCAIRMLYHERGLECEGDPYFLAPIAAFEAARGYPLGHYREAIKKLTQTRINGRDRDKDMRCDLPNGRSFSPRFTRDQVVRMIEEKHAAISDAFGSGAGIWLQRKDSDLALAIITNLRHKGIVALPVHDAFIVDAGYKDELKHEMNRSYQQMFGFSPLLKQSY